MEARLAAGLVVAALIRRVEAEGGNGMVLAKGDATAGALLLQLANRGVAGDLLERALGGNDWQPIGPSDAIERADYLARRRRADTDLWIVELDHRDAATLAAEVISAAYG